MVTLLVSLVNIGDIVGDLLAVTIFVGRALAVSDKGVAVNDTLRISYLIIIIINHCMCTYYFGQKW